MIDDDRSADDMAAKFAPEFAMGTVADFDGAKRARAARVEEDRRRAFFFVPLTQLVVQPTNWRVKGLLEADCVAVVIGEPETLKTFFALDVGLCLASRTPWHGCNVKGGPVLYIAGEGQTNLARRIKAWVRHHGVDLASIPMMFSTMATALTDERAKALLLAEIDKATAQFGAAPVLVVIDTLSRNFGPGDENATSDMQCAGMTLDAIRHATQGGTVLVLHHCGHGDKTRGRGSSVLRGNADAEYLLSKDDGTGIVTLTTKKMKDGPKPEPLAFRPTVVDIGLVGEDGEPETSMVLVSTTYAPPISKTNAGTGKHQIRALDILRERIGVLRTELTASGRDPGEARIAVKEWRSLCEAAHINYRRFREVLGRLEALGLVAIFDDTVALCETYETGAKRDVSSGATASETCESPYKGVRTSHAFASAQKPQCETPETIADANPPGKDGES